MKKLMTLVILMALSLFSLNCDSFNGGDGGDYTEYVIDAETGANVYVVSDLSQGQYGWYRVQKEVDGMLFMVEEGNTLINQAEYTFQLEPGKYWIDFSGLNFSGVTDFVVKEGKVTDVVLYLDEVEIIHLFTNTSASSPNGAIVQGNDIEIFRFSIYNSGNIPVTPWVIDIGVDFTGDITVDNCYLQIETLAGWNTIGGPITAINFQPGNSDFNFNGYNGDLDLTLPVYPLSANYYSLRCDVTGSSTNVLKAQLNGLGAFNDNGAPYMVDAWAVGNWLTL
jgi:hypothetical protein